MHTQKMVVRIQRENDKVTNQQVLCFDESGNCTFFNIDIDTKSRNFLEGLVCNPLYEFDSEKTVRPNGMIRVRTYTWKGLPIKQSLDECEPSDACPECHFVNECNEVA